MGAAELPQRAELAQKAELPRIEAGQSVIVRVPATSANLGPGFDSLGLALSLYDTLTVETLPGDELLFELSGEGAESLPRDASHLTVRSIDHALSRLGYQRSGLRIVAENVIPHGRGLGSSAAAIVAAISAAHALVPAEAQNGEQWIFQQASELEGHPDNVAPALFGGLAISWQEGDNYRSARVQVRPEVHPVVAVPAVELSTETARAMLPSSVSHQNAAANSGRAALLIHALSTAPELLLAATEDYLHQGYRAQAMQGSAELMGVWRKQGLAAVISGAGPTVLALAYGAEQAQLAQSLAAAQNSSENDEFASKLAWRVQQLEIDTNGAKMELHRR
ncbi:homoserine kinase [Psychromicrobium silvestre]|uniref:Homoserine kinase n=1 Tax=Psychromicrobium silvestre TaxID=1645614 RepID=A0A7Y9LSK2_9MICC|nr:homoserine kinase [Psychromicrobium silvestre]NYE94814.1 homoserine kinase [Psychromicrobium silvestre]